MNRPAYHVFPSRPAVFPDRDGEWMLAMLAEQKFSMAVTAFVI